jgi:transcriptional regulator with XRE-family HTH domain
MGIELDRNIERYRQFVEEERSSPDYWSEAAAYELIREIEERMEQQGVSRAELARRLGTSKAYVTKVLGGNANFTLTTMARLAQALGGRIQVHIADPSAVKGREGRRSAPQPGVPGESSSSERRPRG